MDLIDFFENMGLGAGIVTIICIVLFAVLFLGRIIPVLLIGLGSVLSILVSLAIIGAAIYFIGKFAKDFIKK